MTERERQAEERLLREVDAARTVKDVYAAISAYRYQIARIKEDKNRGNH